MLAAFGALEEAFPGFHPLNAVSELLAVLLKSKSQGAAFGTGIGAALDGFDVLHFVEHLLLLNHEIDLAIKISLSSLSPRLRIQ